MPKILFYANRQAHQPKTSAPVCSFAHCPDPSSVETVIIAVPFSATVTLLFSPTVAIFSSLDFLYIHIGNNFSITH